MAILEAKGLTKTFGPKVAVNGINLTVDRGQFVAFLGPNGAGKSTTIGMLTGLIQPPVAPLPSPITHLGKWPIVNRLGLSFRIVSLIAN